MPGTAVGDMQNSWCVEQDVLARLCRSRELFPVLLEQQVIPVQLKHCLEESGVPLQPQHSVWGRG